MTRAPWAACLAWAAVAALPAGCREQRDDGEWQPPAPGDRRADPGGDLPVAPDQLPAESSSFLTIACALGLGFALTRSLQRMRACRRQAESEESVDPVAPLRPGPFVVVGTIEPDDRGRCPVTVRIDQTGQEKLNKGRWRHVWKETGRETASRPFVLRRDDGVRVTIEPGERVAVHHQRWRTEKTGHPARRVQIAELAAGDRVFASGTLTDLGSQGGGGIYRDAPRQPSLVASPRTPLVLSSEPPGDTARRQLRVHRLCALIAMGVIAALGNFVAGPYLLRAALGRTVTAQIELVRVYRVWHKPRNKPGYWVEHQEAHLGWPRGGGRASETVEIERQLYWCALDHGCTQVVVLEAELGGYRTWQLGSHATMTGGQAIILGLVTFVALFLRMIYVRSSRPWYAREQMTDYGPGRLPT